MRWWFGAQCMFFFRYAVTVEKPYGCCWKFYFGCVQSVEYFLFEKYCLFYKYVYLFSEYNYILVEIKNV